MGEENGGNLRGRVFGGFNRRDVAAYIEKVAKESNGYKAECERLNSQNKELVSKMEELSAKNAELASKCEALEAKNEELTAECNELRPLVDTVAALQAKLDENAEKVASYERLKGRLSEMEVAACKRAQEIEEAALAQYERIMDRISSIISSLKSEYEDIRSGTEITAAHLRGEMNRMGERISLVNSVLEKTAVDLDGLDDIIVKKGLPYGTYGGAGNVTKSN